MVTLPVRVSYLTVALKLVPEPFKVRVASSDRQFFLLENGQVRVELHFVVSEALSAEFVSL